MSTAKSHSALRRLTTRIIAVITTTVCALALITLPSAAPSAQANSTPTAFCRSTDGTGATYEADATKNGFYVSGGIRIEPVFAKRMYTDIGAGYDANYVAYKITNNSGSLKTNLWVQLSGFETGVVKPVSAQDTLQQIASLANGASATRYFLLKATSIANAPQRHDVRVFQGTPEDANSSQVGSCFTNISWVQRSIAANANKVTSIKVDATTPKLGDTLTVTVDGTPGTVGSGTASPEDLSVMAISPAAYSRWPTHALRLESMRVQINNIKNLTGCQDHVKSLSSSSTKTAVYLDTLVIRSFSTCVSNKSTYTASYTFRVIGVTSSDPVITPVASISSGTQIKYTGSYPALSTTVALSTTTVPLSVTKTYSSHTIDTAAATVDVTYKIRATTTTTSAQIDALLDDPPEGAELRSASFTDATRTNLTIAGIQSTFQDSTVWKFSGPFTATTSQPVVLTYVVRHTLSTPANAGTTVTNTFVNTAFGISGTYVVSSGDKVTGVEFEVTANSDGTFTAQKPTPLLLDRNKQQQAINFDVQQYLGTTETIALTGSADSGLPVSYRTSTPNVCVLSEFDGSWRLTALKSGTCEVTATQLGDDTFAAATDVTRTITVLENQVISHTSASFAANQTTTFTAQSTSTLQVAITSLNTEVCTITTKTPYNPSTGVTEFTVTKGTVAGSCVLIATQPGGEATPDGSTPVTYAPAPELEIIIGVGKEQTITFESPNAGAEVNRTDTVSAVATTTGNVSLTGDTQLPISYRSTTPTVCDVDLQSLVNSSGEIGTGLDTTTKKTTVKLKLFAAGTCSIVASQDGVNNLGDPSEFAPAADVVRTFTVKAAGTTEQQLTISSDVTVTYGDGSVTVVSESLDSTQQTPTNLLVSFTTTSPLCKLGSPTLVGGESHIAVSFTGAGTCVITPSQAGNDTYRAWAQDPNTPVEMTITVKPKPVTITGLSVTEREYDAGTVAPLAGTPTLDGVVPGDTPTDIAVTGTITANYDTPDAGENKTAPLTGGSLTGAKTSSYLLQHTTVTGVVKPRALTLMAQDQTIGVTETPTCTWLVSVGALQGSDTFKTASVTCDFGAYNPQTPQTGEYVTSVTGAVILDANTQVSTNYTITYATGTLVVTELETVTIETIPLEVVYGTDLPTILAETEEVDGVTVSQGVRAKNANGQLVSGTATYELLGAPVNSQAYDASTTEYTLEIRFAPSEVAANKDNGKQKYAPASTLRRLKIVPRTLTTDVQAKTREYDGTRTATFVGGSTLKAKPGGDGLGVLDADKNDLQIEGVVTGEFAAKDVGTYDIAVSGLKLSGAKSKNYVFEPPATTRAAITPKGLRVTVQNQIKLLGEDDPPLVASVSGFVADESVSDVSPVVFSREDGDQVGTYTISASGADSTNYDPVYEPGILYIADININVNEDDIVNDRLLLTTDRTVTCNCTGLVPGETVTLTIFSEPTVIDTVTVPDDGTCPFANTLTIPATVPEGDHTLELLSTFEDTSGVATIMPVTLSSSIADPDIGSDPSGDPTPADPDPGQDPTLGGGAPTDTNETGDSSTQPGTVARWLTATGGATQLSAWISALMIMLLGVGVLASRRRYRPGLGHASVRSPRSAGAAGATDATGAS